MSTNKARTESVFSYGALRRLEVQRAMFGRTLEARSASLSGFELLEVPVDPGHHDPIFGDSETRLILTKADQERATIPGAVLAMSPDELSIADGFEAPDYARRVTQLDDGSEAWVFFPI